MASTTASDRGIAIVFPGQGSQRPGMAGDFCAEFSVARDVFAEASDALHLDLGALCAGGEEQLALTEYTQPAILTAEVAIFRALQREYGLAATHFGGHSLGEYSALCAAEVIPLADAVRIVRARGAAMQRAVPPGLGGMLVVSRQGVAECTTDSVGARFELDLASVNSPNQIVLSGLSADLLRAQMALTAEGFELTRLDVSAPFHSRFMKSIEPRLLCELEATLSRWRPALACHVASNALGGFHAPGLRAIASALVRQVSAPVRWLENMAALSTVAERIIEIGPSSPLRGLFRAVGRSVRSITTLTSAARELRS